MIDFGQLGKIRLNVTLPASGAIGTQETVNFRYIRIRLVSPRQHRAGGSVEI